MKRIPAQIASGLLLAVVALGLMACKDIIYRVPQNNFSGRPIPPSQLLQRVLVTYTPNGTSGSALMLDGLRDLRNNVQNTIPLFPISGFSASLPTTILNFPEETAGYILSYTDGGLTAINYSKESSAGAVASFGPFAPSAAASPDGTRFAGANEGAGIVTIVGVTGSNGAGSYALNLPNVFKVAINQGNSVMLAMVRNSNTLYRIIKLPSTNNPVIPPGSVDCEPLILPVYCVVPVKGTFDRPTDVFFTTDGSTAYVLNCGPECGGTTASVSALQVAPLVVDNIPTANPLDPAAPTTMKTLPVANPIPIPGGVTAALSDGANLYLAGQSLFSLTGGVLGNTPRADGLFTGYLTAVNLSTYAVSNPISISDGTHSKMLFADDNTLWVGAQKCASGERAKQNLNYNCLTRVALGSTLSAQIVPNVTPGGATTVPYPNDNQNLYYYGDLNGLCWVQNYHKVYTGYGGQIHAFNTADGSEINNVNITVQGTVLDVAYMDALTNSAN
ncbi:MAG TPA: hypothetical protein VGN16_18085 [Acidobacteriaceae bacterium]|jgi:hypothetical protein